MFVGNEELHVAVRIKKCKRQSDQCSIEMIPTLETAVAINFKGDESRWEQEVSTLPYNHLSPPLSKNYSADELEHISLALSNLSIGQLEARWKKAKKCVETFLENALVEAKQEGVDRLICYTETILAERMGALKKIYIDLGGAPKQADVLFSLEERDLVWKLFEEKEENPKSAAAHLIVKLSHFLNRKKRGPLTKYDLLDWIRVGLEPIYSHVFAQEPKFQASFPNLSLFHNLFQKVDEVKGYMAECYKKFGGSSKRILEIFGTEEERKNFRSVMKTLIQRAQKNKNGASSKTLCHIFGEKTIGIDAAVACVLSQGQPVCYFENLEHLERQEQPGWWKAVNVFYESTSSQSFASAASENPLPKIYEQELLGVIHR